MFKVNKQVERYGVTTSFYYKRFKFVFYYNKIV